MGDSLQSTPPPPSLFCNEGSERGVITDDRIKSILHSFLTALGDREDVLILPPDYTRFHSQAGKITRFICEYYNYIPSSKGCHNKRKHGEVVVVADEKDEETSPTPTPTISILPALGTHAPMTDVQIRKMFGDELADKRPSPFMVHDWRNDVVTIGHAPKEMVSEATDGMVDQPWPAQLNTHVWSKRRSKSTSTSPNNPKPHPSLILSIGQVVPHEVMGMANFNKNLFVGVGGVEAINLSHFIGAVHGMERMMGRASNPLRSILNYASKAFLEKELDLWYILTVVGTNEQTGEGEVRGFYIGNDIECYNCACELSIKINFTMLDRAPTRMVVNLCEDEFHSTWLGNKAIYRTRMAVADGGEVIVLAPGVSQFGEDATIDQLIRKHGYVGTPAVLKAMEKSVELQENLSAVAHLIHGSSEGRFSITYCPGHLTKEEIESVGFRYGDLEETKKLYDVNSLRDGWNKIVNSSGVEEEFFYISNPALGLWAVQSRFDDSSASKLDADVPTISATANQSASDGSGGVGGWARPPKDQST